MPKIKDKSSKVVLEEKKLLYMWGGGEKTAYFFACLFLNTHFLHFVYINSQDLKKKKKKNLKSTMELHLRTKPGHMYPI